MIYHIEATLGTIRPCFSVPFFQKLLLTITLTLLVFVGSQVAADATKTNTSDKESVRRAKIAAGSNANAVLSLDLIANGGAGNRVDDGVTTGTVSGNGTKIAIEVFATGVTTSLVGLKLEFEFDASVLTFDKAENSAFALIIPEATGASFAGVAPVTLPASNFIARAEFSTVVDVTGREFSIGIKQVTLAESATSSDVITTTHAIAFNATLSPDFDGDGMVGFSDFLAFAGQYGSNRGDGRYQAQYDLDGSGAIDFSDFLTFANSYGQQVPPSGGRTPPTSTPTSDHAALTAGLPERPFVDMTVGGTEGSTKTVGTLRLGLNPNVFPVIVRESEHRADVLVAGSRLGEGKIAAFSGQDFLGPDDRATLLGHANADRLVANAVRWVAGEGTRPLRVLVDNPRVASAVEGQGLEEVEVVGRGPGYWERDWSASALGDADVVVVLTNHWGTATLTGKSVGPLRAFVERGGGLVIAGSALHWSWWIEQGHGTFTGNTLLRGTGISWNEDSIDEIVSASTRFDLEALAPGVVWGAYLAGGQLDSTQMSLLPGLFSTALELGRTGELNTALARLVRETPRLPVSVNAPEARLAAEVASSLGPHEWPETHPWATVFPGLPDPNARRVDGSVVVDATYGEFPADARRRERHLPLGFYAPPGGLVTISVPSSHATGELAIEVGQEHNDLRFISEHTEWHRAPALRRVFDVTAAETAITNAYGGSLALVIPESYRGTIPVTVEGAIPMAVYTAGESNAAEWFAALDAGAPQAIIQKLGGIRFVISAERARGITDPGEVSAFWDGFRRHHAELAGEPVLRAYESIWIFDPQVGWGYANAGWLTVNYPLHGESWVLVPGTATGRAWLATLPNEGPTPHTYPPPRVYSPAMHGVDWWLFGHELGHQWQTEDWGAGQTYPEIGEVAVNLFTMYTLNYYIFGGGDSTLISGHDHAPESVDHAALARLSWPTADVFDRLSMYRQLISEFGWGPIKQVFQSYYDQAYPRSKYGGELDGFAIRFSAIVQRDMVGFFRRWEYPLSESAAATIRDFGFKEWLPPGW